MVSLRMPGSPDPTRSDLPDEIGAAIEALMYESRAWYCAPEASEIVQARATLTAAILARLTAAEAERDAALARVERMEKALGFYRSAAVTSAAMEGLSYQGVSGSMFRHAWESDRAALAAEKTDSP